MKVLLGQTLSFAAEPGRYQHEARGALVIGAAGKIVWCGPAEALPSAFHGAQQQDFGDQLILPGFIDAHIHFPQQRILAAPGKDLLDWLNRFTFPEEARYAETAYARQGAEVFLQTLFRHGTTGALAFCSVHKSCAEALFEAALAKGMAMITGKTLMDRMAPTNVLDDVESGTRDSEALYRAFHDKGRLRYAITPRFAITSSDAQLAAAGQLLARLPAALLHTHLSESAGEIAQVKALFPGDADYTGVYERHGLLSERSLFAHGIHLSESECQRLSDNGASIIHCPTSNSFLGSGLMRMSYLAEARRPISLGLATDVGGGTSYSMLTTMGEAYKVQMLAGDKPTALSLFRLATRGNAERLKIDADVGALEPGKWADLVILDSRATPVLAARDEVTTTLEDRLFALAILGDDRAVAATFVAGVQVHERLSA